MALILHLRCHLDITWTSKAVLIQYICFQILLGYSWDLVYLKIIHSCLPMDDITSYSSEENNCEENTGSARQLPSSLTQDRPSYASIFQCHGVCSVFFVFWCISFSLDQEGTQKLGTIPVIATATNAVPPIEVSPQLPIENIYITCLKLPLHTSYRDFQEKISSYLCWNNKALASSYWVKFRFNEGNKQNLFIESYYGKNISWVWNLALYFI